MASLPSSRLPDAVVSPIQSHFVLFMSLTIFLSKDAHRMTHHEVVRYNDPYRLATHRPPASNNDEPLACQRNPVRQTARPKTCRTATFAEADRCGQAWEDIAEWRLRSLAR